MDNHIEVIEVRKYSFAFYFFHKDCKTTSFHIRGYVKQQ